MNRIGGTYVNLHTSKRMHFIEDLIVRFDRIPTQCLHTSKRMHFIEDSADQGGDRQRRALHTSKRMHFIEEALLS